MINLFSRSLANVLLHSAAGGISTVLPAVPDIPGEQAEPCASAPVAAANALGPQRQFPPHGTSGRRGAEGGSAFA